MVEGDHKTFSSLNNAVFILHRKRTLNYFKYLLNLKIPLNSYCFGIFPHSLNICKWIKQHLLLDLLNFYCEFISGMQTIRAPLIKFIIKLCLKLRKYRGYLQLSRNYQLNVSGMLNSISHE
jgi:hypothetical protein